LKQAVAALSLLVLVLVASNAWTLRSNVELRSELKERDDKLQKLVAAAKAQKKAAPSGATGRLAKARAARAEVARRKKTKSGRVAPDPQKQAALRDRYRDAMLDDRVDAVVDLADERGWSDALTSEVIALFEETNSLMTAVREDVTGGVLSAEDGRDEMAAIREEVGQELAVILGSDEYEIFRQRIWGNR